MLTHSTLLVVAKSEILPSSCSSCHAFLILPNLPIQTFFLFLPLPLLSLPDHVRHPSFVMRVSLSDHPSDLASVPSWTSVRRHVSTSARGSQVSIDKRLLPLRLSPYFACISSGFSSLALSIHCRVTIMRNSETGCSSASSLRRSLPAGCLLYLIVAEWDFAAQ